MKIYENGARQMKRTEIIELANQLKKVFDTVRIVDAKIMTQYSITENGSIQSEPYRCYEIWHKSGRCENCISAKALSIKKQVAKFEFINDDIYYVIARYIEIDDQPFVLEMVSQITHETLFSAYGKNQLVESITLLNHKLYLDALTGARNRQYYEDQLIGLQGHYAIAMLDIDHFKNINDTYGHEAGDVVLRSIVRIIFSCIRSTDTLVRYGGDEFLIVFRNIPFDTFVEKLERIRKEIAEFVIEQYPSIHFTASIGGINQEGQFEDLIHEADLMLYKAKIERNKVIIKKDS